MAVFSRAPPQHAEHQHAADDVPDRRVLGHQVGDLLDDIGRELGIAPEDVRRANLLTAEDQPTKLITGPSLFGVTARETMEQALEALDLPALRSRQATARDEGRLVGVGFSTFIENAPARPTSPSSARPAERDRVGPARADRRPHGQTWQVTHGQSHETTLAQVSPTSWGCRSSGSARLRRLRHAAVQTMATGGSRAATMGHGSTGRHRADRATGGRIAAHLLEADQADIEWSTARSRPGRAGPSAPDRATSPGPPGSPRRRS